MLWNFTGNVVAIYGPTDLLYAYMYVRAICKDHIS